MKPLRLLLALLMLVTAVMPSLAVACARGCELEHVRLQAQAMAAEHCATAAASPTDASDAGLGHWLDQGPLCQLAVGVTLNSQVPLTSSAAPVVLSLDPLPVFPDRTPPPPYRPPMA